MLIFSDVLLALPGKIHIVGGMEGWRKILRTGEKLTSSQSGVKAQQQAASNRNTDLTRPGPQNV